MRFKVWGSRGSLPAPYSPSELQVKIKDILVEYSEQSLIKNIEDFLNALPRWRSFGFGGETTCVELRTQQGQLIIDGGSGLRRLGLEMMKGPAGKGLAEIHIYLTHFHWDHLLGIPFFVPLFIPGNKIHFYAVEDTLQEAIPLIFKKPYFPVPFASLAAEVKFHKVTAREEFAIADMNCTPYLLDHPDPCWGLKVTADGRSYAHCVDTESKRVSRKDLGDDLPLYQGVDLMYYDAQYSIGELVDKVDWGHATSALGMDIAVREKVKKVAFTHHDPAASDRQIANLESQTKQYLKLMEQSSEDIELPEWLFAYDGLELDI